MESIFFQLTSEDTPYVALLKPVLQGKANITLNNIGNFETAMEVVMRAREKGCTQIATTSSKLLKLLINKPGTIDAWQGSLVKRYGCEFLFVPPVEHLVTVPYAKHLYERYFNKFIHKSNWLQIPEFSWSLFEPKDTQALLELFQRATFIACDIETDRDNPARIITCMSFAAVFINGEDNSFTIKTIVVPFIDLFNVQFCRSVLASRAPKVFQNGKYDNAYLLRYNAPTYNWAFDTINMFHAWYSELPKDLGFLTAYLLREWEYWKDESKTTDLTQYYGYNAKDSFTTAMDLLALLREMPSWAINNFLMEMPLIYPCLLAEMVGIKADKSALKGLADQVGFMIADGLKKVQAMSGAVGYNPNSAKQTLQLFKILGCEDVTSTDVKGRDKVSQRHPINKRIMEGIEDVRKDRKLADTYLQEEKLWYNRWLFALNPHGTDTGRLASKESQFWCGLQIQNIPIRREDIKFKSVFIADEDFYLGEADGEQAEARDTAYLSGDLRLIETVEGDKDYHGVNASRFFGVPYEKIIGPNGEKLDVVLRDHIGKRVNHGANYNMGPGVLIDTMGIANVIKAKQYLKLPARFSLMQVAAYLLSRYDEAYPVVRDLDNGWYAKCVADVTNTGFLIGPTGWHRFCFGNPKKSKHWLNAYVAHPPQSNNAMRLNKCYNRVFYEVWMDNPRDFKLGPQIHDSILFQYRIGRKDLAFKVKEIMERETMMVRDSFGIERLLKVPVALKGESTRWSELKKIKLAA